MLSDARRRPLAASGLPRAAWRRIVHASGVAEPLPCFHDLRHAYATHALAVGLTAHAVAELLGHTDAELVSQRYGHALPGEVAEAGQKIGAWRRSQSDPREW